MVEKKISESKVTFSDVTKIILLSDNLARVISFNELLQFFSKYGTVIEKTDKNIKIALTSMSSSFIYVCVDSDTIIFAENLRLILEYEKDFKSDTESLLSAFEIGFVIPPYTLFKNIYRFWPNAELNICMHNNKYGITLQSYWDEGNENTINYEEAKQVLKQLLIDSIKQAEMEKHDFYCFTISGGVDSSLLLKLASEIIPKDKLVAVTGKSPGQSTELNRAIALVNTVGLNQHFIIDVQEAKQEFYLEYMKEFGEPIFDTIVSVETLLIRKCIEALGTSNIIIVDGQGADSLFMGLPHNWAIHYYSGKKLILSPMSLIANLFLRKSNFYRKSKIGKFMYRASKVLSILSMQDVTKAFLASLGLTGSFTDFSEKYYKRYVDSFEDILHNTGSIHRAISYFFMYRILPVREMQKYRLLIKENVGFSFPYIKEELVNFASSIPESFMFSNGIRKRIIFDIAKETLPEVVYTKVTTPFYFDSSDIFKGMEDEALKTLLPSQFMLLKDRVIDKEQFEFMKRIMNVYFSSCLN